MSEFDFILDIVEDAGWFIPGKDGIIVSSELNSRGHRESRFFFFACEDEFKSSRRMIDISICWEGCLTIYKSYVGTIVFSCFLSDPDCLSRASGELFEIREHLRNGSDW